MGRRNVGRRIERGAAAAVACGAVPIAHGSDATGSLRFPAALCGVATLVPTAGTIESVAPAGQPPSPWWRDFVLARDARDLELMLGLLAPESSPAPVVARQRRASVLDHDPELGMVVEPECRQAVRTVAALLEDLGWVVDERWPPALDSLWQRVGAALGVVSDATRPPVFEWVAGRLGRRLTEDELPAEVFAAAARDAGRSTEDRSKAGATIEAVVAPIADWFREVDVLITPATFQAGWPLESSPVSRNAARSRHRSA
ncbi:MAG: amidase family protein [Acidimicrobiales bacterium]